MAAKVSVQGILAFGGHFETLSQGVDFYAAKKCIITNFQKEKENTFTILMVFIVRRAAK